MLPMTESWQVLYISANGEETQLGLKVMHMQKGAGFGLCEMGCLGYSIYNSGDKSVDKVFLHMRNQQKNMSSFSTKLE